MIKHLMSGHYKLVQTKKHHTKMLYIDTKAFAWVSFNNIGEILVKSRNDYLEECVLSVGDYKLYEVKNEPKLHDSTHLELYVGNHTWQGYLLITGMPDENKKRARIIPTAETITNNLLYKSKSQLKEKIYATH